MSAEGKDLKAKIDIDTRVKQVVKAFEFQKNIDKLANIQSIKDAFTNNPEQYAEYQRHHFKLLCNIYRIIVESESKELAAILTGRGPNRVLAHELRATATDYPKIFFKYSYLVWKKYKRLDSLLDLANCYADGIGVEKNGEVARSHYETLQKATEYDLKTFAYYGLVKLYETGNGVAKNYKIAFELLLENENRGVWVDGINAYKLGWCFEHGIGCTQDLTQANKYYNLGQNKGGIFLKYAFIHALNSPILNAMQGPHDLFPELLEQLCASDPQHATTTSNATGVKSSPSIYARTYSTAVVSESEIILTCKGMIEDFGKSIIPRRTYNKEDVDKQSAVISGYVTMIEEAIAISNTAADSVFTVQQNAAASNVSSNTAANTASSDSAANKGEAKATFPKVSSTLVSKFQNLKVSSSAANSATATAATPCTIDHNNSHAIVGKPLINAFNNSAVGSTSAGATSAAADSTSNNTAAAKSTSSKASATLAAMDEDFDFSNSIKATNQKDMK